MRSALVAIAFALIGCAENSPQVPAELIAEARSLAPDLGEAIWPGLGDGPFRVLLIDGETERLFCAEESVPDSFAPMGRDVATDCDVHERPRQFDPNLLAAFPLSDGVGTIVVGTPEATEKSPEAWVATLLHELVHIRQYASPGYDERTRALGLHGGDETGMWMLTYPFPYQDDAAGEAFARLAGAAADALEARGGSGFGDALDGYLSARTGFAATISDADLRYYDLQAWQEGTARYVERRIEADWAKHPATEASIMRDLSAELRGMDLAADERVAFYPLGAAEAFLLDAAAPGWERRYLDGPLSLGARLEGRKRS